MGFRGKMYRSKSDELIFQSMQEWIKFAKSPEYKKNHRKYSGIRIHVDNYDILFVLRNGRKLKC